MGIKRQIGKALIAGGMARGIWSKRKKPKHGFEPTVNFVKRKLKKK